MPEEQNEKQEKGYEVRDKRRVNPDGSPKENAEEPKQENQAETATAGGAQEQQEVPPPNIYALLQIMVGLLAEQSWQLMGIRLAPGQKEVTKDLAQAKIGIDTINFIFDKLHPHLNENERNSLRALVSDLQINYVRQSQ